MLLEVRNSSAAAATAAASAIAEQIREAVSARGVAAVALSGGRTPDVMVRDLAERSLPWERVHLFQVDERRVPSDDPARNWLNLAPLCHWMPDDHLHPMPVEASDADQTYAKSLEMVAGQPAVLDVVHLGLGDDGHTASLVPDDQVLDVTDRDVAWVPHYRGHARLTLTIPALKRARAQVWLVAGGAKASAVAGLVSGDVTLPAARVASDAAASIYLDEDAAALLPS